MAVNKGNHAKVIGAAVRAELARRGRSIASLAPVLGVGKGAVYARAKGVEAFDYVELQLIADDLGITIKQLIDSAELTRPADGRSAA